MSGSTGSTVSLDQRGVLVCTDQERAMLSELASTLIVGNFEQYNSERHDKTSPLVGSKSRRWKEIRKKEGIRIYQEREVAGQAPALPSLLMCGTIVGSLEDVMYATAAHSNDSSQIKSFIEQDGVVDSRILDEVVGPSVKDPFHHVQVKWHAVAQPEAVDFVTLDASGLAAADGGETIGYHLMHSIDFERLASVRFSPTRSVKRGNMSVCALYRQKTPSEVEVHARGFYDVGAVSKDSMFLLGVANHWLSSFSRKTEVAQAKKLAWLVRRKLLEQAALRSSTWSVASMDNQQQMQKLLASADPNSSSTVGRCKVCSKSFGFLGTSRRNCRCCEQVVCTRCSVAKVLVEVVPSSHFESSSSSGSSGGSGGGGGVVVEKKRTFCSQCMTEAARGNACSIAREEVLGCT